MDRWAHAKLDGISWDGNPETHRIRGDRSGADCAIPSGWSQSVRATRRPPYALVAGFGQRDFGENYLQEALPKLQALPTCR